MSLVEERGREVYGDNLSGNLHHDGPGDAREHGGAVAIDSDPGRGTKVTLTVSRGRAGHGAD